MTNFIKSKKTDADADVVITSLRQLRDELSRVHTSIDYAVDDTLIDSYIYELKALNMKYQYFLNLAKQKGIVAQR